MGKKGQWVRYKLWYEGKCVIPYVGSKYKWEYFYLDCCHMETWKKSAIDVFKEYITDQGIYTARVQRIPISIVPKRILNKETQRMKLKIKECLNDVNITKRELINLIESIEDE